MSPRKAILTFSLVIATIAGFSAAPAYGILIEKVVAVVNGEVLTLSELQEEGKPLLRRIVQELTGEEQKEQMKATQQQLLEAMILRRLQLQEAKKEEIQTPPAEVTAAIEGIKRRGGFETDEELKAALAKEGITFERFKKGIEEQLLLSKIVTKQVTSTVILSEEELQRYYQEHQDQYKRPLEVKLRHIFIQVPQRADEEEVSKAEARAEEALAAIRAGMDFAEAAARYSDGPTAKEGGELGRMKQGELAPELEKAAFSLPVGEVSDLIRMSGGFSIIKVEERTTDPSIPFAEVREAIQKALYQEKLQAKLKEWLDSLKSKAAIEVKGLEVSQARPPSLESSQ
ncbi:MAG: peptidylprolyl isomerase [candidate division NC10 bacterium]|nr:peptidylprolyl isomerase [candidate division NC10 bacterium]